MKILVTGGAGYTGSVLLPMLLEKGHEIVLLDSFMWGIQPIFHFASHPKLSIIEGDVRDAALVKSAMKGCDMVLHLAAIVGYPACSSDPARAKAVNLGGTKNVVDALDGRSLIFASTGSTYGKVNEICTEETPINPLTLYGSTKWESELLVKEVDGISLRFATVFGMAPRLRLDLLINDFTYQALKQKQIILYEGHFRRTFLHVIDAARSYLFSIENFDKMKGGSYNVGDETMNFTKREVCLKIQEHVDYYLHEADVGEDKDKRDYEVSYEKIKSLGYAATVSMDDGIEELAKVLKHVHINNPFRNA